MKQIGLYSEFLQDCAPTYAATLPKMADSFSDAPVPHKDEIIRYLLQGELGSVPSGKMIDVFSGEITDVFDAGRSDGQYEWGQGLAYYVDKYNLMLPEDFVDHILAQSA